MNIKFQVKIKGRKVTILETLKFELEFNEYQIIITVFNLPS
jgi:hypothetical protein